MTRQDRREIRLPNARLGDPGHDGQVVADNQGVARHQFDESITYADHFAALKDQAYDGLVHARLDVTCRVPAENG